ncbi:MAG: S-layer homology domain-containing protein [Oscillospiraceae bacterium]|nr:S-layer homology domain-containing protein [Oscillospiraceae bacterium]
MVARTVIGRENIPPAAELPFPDRDAIPNWAEDEVYAAFRNGWVRGNEHGEFLPGTNLTRASAIAVICRVLGRGITTAHSTRHVSEQLIPFSDVTNANHWYYHYVRQATNTHRFRSVPSGEGFQIEWTQVEIDLAQMLGVSFSQNRPLFGQLEK